MGRVVVFGSLSQDLHLDMPRHPRSGETLMSGDIDQKFGGKGANQAVAAALAGAEAMFVGKVGDDEPGQDYRRRLERFGVDVSRLETVPDAPTGTAIIYIDEHGENMIVVAPGANRRMTTDDLAKLADTGPGDVVLFQLELPIDVVVAAARQVHRQGARVIISIAPYAELPQDVLDLADPVIVNEHEQQLMEQAGGHAPSLLVTLGADGARWGDLQVAAVPVEVVDTTGAGDAYCGTLAARLAAGEDRESAMRAASAAAGRNVEHSGAQPPLPAG